MKKLTSSSSVLCLAWLLMLSTSALSQILNLPIPVLDTNGGSLQPGVPYYIQPAPRLIPRGGGRFTLISRNGTCPLYVGQDNSTEGQGLPVTFTPHVAGDNVVRTNSDFTVAFSAATICNQSTQWRLASIDTTTGRRLIITGTTNGTSVDDYSNYFRISSLLSLPLGYFMQWCPRIVCPACRFNCGDVGPLSVQDGNSLVALDGNRPLYVQFVRA